MSTEVLDDEIASARAAAELDAAQEAMRVAVKAARAEGRAIPCIADDAGLWLSERAAERARAARKCATCPVLAECEALAVCGAASFGVYGGKDYTAPPPAEAPRLPVNPEARLRVLSADPDRRQERNQLVVALRKHKPQVWTTAVLAAATGLHRSAIHTLIKTDGRTTDRPRREPRPNGWARANERHRMERVRAEVDALDHPIVKQLRAYADRPGTVQKWERDRRNELLIQLARSSSWWTFERLAAAASMSQSNTVRTVKDTLESEDRRGTVRQGTTGYGRTTHIRSAE